MSFLYVDRITEYVPGKLIRGIKYVTRDEPSLFLAADGRRRLRETMIIESLAQLGSWLAIADHEFRQRPLFLGEDLAEFGDHAYAGDRLDLAIEILRVDDEVVETAGTVKRGGQLILRSHSAKGFLMPMEGFADPLHMARRFQLLLRPETPGKGGLPRPPTLTESPFWHLSRNRPTELVDGIVSLTPHKEVEAFKNVTASEAYFEEHFPRQPVVPGVVLLTLSCDACEHLLARDIAPLGDRRRLTLRRIVNGRFRKVVTPGDQCLVKAQVKSLAPGRMEVAVGIFANGARVCQAHLDFDVAA